ncbi:MAG: hypothetical protein QXE05_13155 [Nitrososphaeria archaeon]
MTDIYLPVELRIYLFIGGEEIPLTEILEEIPQGYKKKLKENIINFLNELIDETDKKDK